jgi:uncharacterized phage infection (PIP) family protein YhgE
MYRVDTYFLARQLVELPFSLLLPSLFLTIFYLMVGLDLKLDKFLLALLTVLLVVQVAVSVGEFPLYATNLVLSRHLS